MFEQERLIGRLQRRVTDDPEISACFLSGSFGRRASDSYSDLDVALVYPNSSSLERAWHNRIQFTKSIMPYISLKSFDAEHVRPYFHIALFSNGSKLDLRFENQEILMPNPWDSQIRILKDTEGWAELFQQDSSQQAVPQPRMNSQELARLDQRFWVMYWDILRLLARGNTDKSFPIYLELLNMTLPPMLQALPNDDRARVNLIDVQFNRDRDMTTTHLKRLLTAYIAARTAIVERYHLQFSTDNAFENQIQRLVEKIG